MDIKNPIGMDIESAVIDRIRISCWDLGGADKIWPLLIGYISSLRDFSGLVLVIDSNESEWIEDADLKLQLLEVRTGPRNAHHNCHFTQSDFVAFLSGFWPTSGTCSAVAQSKI